MSEERLEKLILAVYKNWKKRFSKKKSTLCPNEETLTCFKEGLLSNRQEEMIRQHLLFCDKCSENVILDAKVKPVEKELPEGFLQTAKDIFRQAKEPDIFEVVLALKDKFLEIIRTSADFWETKDLGLEPVFLRGPGVKKISDEVHLIKYFGSIKVNLKIQKEELDKIKIDIILTDKKTGKPKEGLRVTLKKGNEEIESYITREGKVTFFAITSGHYEIEISEVAKKLGRISLELR
ncbi:MAG: hypothetical protein NC829_00465 [Candidatus Omnitrophica bacterium]|nr:hypothetical protein [Candidatus Omnitrophota bacterium]